jgi:hypothetical protein
MPICSLSKGLRSEPSRVEGSPDALWKDNEVRAHLPAADGNLEGTYLVRIFAAFEAAPFKSDLPRGAG